MYGFHGGRCGGVPALPPIRASRCMWRCARLHSCVRGGGAFDGLREAFFLFCFAGAEVRGGLCVLGLAVEKEEATTARARGAPPPSPSSGNPGSAARALLTGWSSPWIDARRARSRPRSAARRRTMAGAIGRVPTSASSTWSASSSRAPTSRCRCAARRRWRRSSTAWHGGLRA